jgi:HAD superfamily hydrolase (TIGR01490 family)
MNYTRKCAPERIAAFFDLDGTLLPAPSLEWRFLGHLLAHDEIPTSNIARWIGRWMRSFPFGPAQAACANKSYLAGLRESLGEDWKRSLRKEQLPFFASGLQRVRRHLAQQHSVFFVTGTLEPLARIAASQIPGRIEVCATRLEVCDGHWTGFLEGEHMSGKAKARALQALAADRGFDLPCSFAYGDEIADLSMLRAVGHPAAINPSARLERAARQRGWRIWDWRSVQKPAPIAETSAVGRIAAGARGQLLMTKVAR